MEGRGTGQTQGGTELRGWERMESEESVNWEGTGRDSLSEKWDGDRRWSGRGASPRLKGSRGRWGGWRDRGG